MEIPLYNFIVPPDDACMHYGIPAGLRDRLKKANDYFDTADGEITGMDWNLWNEFGMTPAEFTATLEYSLDQHLTGNRVPMTVGIHSELLHGARGGPEGGARASRSAAPPWSPSSPMPWRTRTSGSSTTESSWAGSATRSPSAEPPGRGFRKPRGYGMNAPWTDAT